MNGFRLEALWNNQADTRKAINTICTSNHKKNLMPKLYPAHDVTSLELIKQLETIITTPELAVPTVKFNLCFAFMAISDAQPHCNPRGSKQQQVGTTESLTGAIYSSVPTKELEGVTGSEKNTGSWMSVVFLRRTIVFTGGINCTAIQRYVHYL